MKKLALLFIFISFSVMAEDSISKKSCPIIQRTKEAPSEASLLKILSENNIQIVFGKLTDPKVLANFVDDYHRFPLKLREEMKNNNSRIHLIIGTSVAEDPSWNEEAKLSLTPEDWVTTHDGRKWDTIPGSGGGMFPTNTPTRIVINRMNEGHGASNLFLHEYAHALDSMYGEHVISRSKIWKEILMRDPQAEKFLNSICPSYCTDLAHPEEGFAELFAYYHSCEVTKSHMRYFLPTISLLFDRMTSARDFLDGKIVLTPPSPPR